MSRNLRRSRRSCNCAATMSLFAWAEALSQPGSTRSLAVRLIQRRTQCATSTARLIAGLAGYPIDGDA